MTTEDTANLVLFLLACGLGAVAVLRHRGPGRFGVGRRGAVRSYATGWVLGAVAIAVLAALLVALGGAELDGGGGWSAAPAAWLTTIAFLAVLGLVEEFVFRALLLRGTIAVLGPSRAPVVAALVVTGVLTSAPYLLEPASSALSMVGAVLGGVTYGVAYLRSGGIWLSAGMRTAWNVVLGPVLGFTVSASTFLPAVARAVPTGPPVLTGGAYGPEGGVVALGVRVVLLAVLLGLPAGLLRHRPATDRVRDVASAEISLKRQPDA